MEMSGRKGVFLPFLLAGLLIPAASVSVDSLFDFPRPPVRISGEIPPEIANLPTVTIVETGPAHVHFSRDESGVLTLTGRWIPEEFRSVLDEGNPNPVHQENLSSEVPLPERSLLLALIASSVLSGAVAESLPGERSRRTLETLLAAAITRWELIVGKWAAWAGLGAGAATTAALVAVLLGRQAAGPWLLALPLVPACTVALGMFLVRSSSDLIGGSAVAIRVLPALLSVAGVSAWVLGRVDPHLGAALPLGGALLAAGGLWDDWTAILLALGSTGGTTLGLLAITARDVGNYQSRTSFLSSQWRQGLLALAIGGFAWGIPVIAPALWAMAGNPGFAASLSLESAQYAGALVLLAATATLHLQGQPAVGGSTTRRHYAAALLLSPALNALLRLPSTGTHFALERAWEAIQPGLLPSCLLVAVAQELFFRGWVQRNTHGWVGIGISTIVLFPHQWLGGWIFSASLALLTARAGSIGPAMVAHLFAMVPNEMPIWLVLFMTLPAMLLVMPPKGQPDPQL